MIASFSPDEVLALGDNNYQTGSNATIDANVGAYFRCVPREREPAGCLSSSGAGGSAELEPRPANRFAAPAAAAQELDFAVSGSLWRRLNHRQPPVAGAAIECQGLACCRTALPLSPAQPPTQAMISFLCCCPNRLRATTIGATRAAT